MRTFAARERRGRLTLLASRDGREGSVTVQQDVAVYSALGPHGAANRPLGLGRHAWIQIARGAVELNGLPLGSGDGAAVSDELTLELRASTDSETLLLELA